MKYYKIKLFRQNHEYAKLNCYFSLTWYRAFHRLGQAKIAHGGLVFWLEPIFATDPAASENDACFKSGQNWLKNDHLASLI